MVLRQLIQEKEDHESMVLVLLSRSIKIGPKQTNTKRLLTPKRVEFAYGYGLNFIFGNHPRFLLAPFALNTLTILGNLLCG